MRGRLRLATVIAVAICLAAPVFADNGGPVTLALKFTQGDTITYDISFSGAGSLVAPDGTRSATTLQGSMTLNEHVTQVKADGSGVVEMLMPQADISLGIKGKSVRFSYANEKFRWFTGGKEQTPPQELGRTKLPLLQTPVLLTLAPDGRTSAVSFADQQIMDTIRKAVPGVDQALTNLTTTALLPDHPVSIGESWTRNQQIPTLPGLTATCKVRRTLESVMGGAEQQVAKISGYTATTLRAPSFAPPGQQNVTISIPQLRHTITSTEFFNTTAGRLMQANYDVSFSTKVSASTQGQAQSGSVEGRVIVSVMSH